MSSMGGSVLDNTIICIFGKKGSGKTTLARECAEDWRKVVFIDVMGEYAAKHRCWGYEECVATIHKLCDKRAFRISCTGIDPEEGGKLLEVCRNIPGVLVVIEEAGLYCSPSNLPPGVAELVYRGRHYGVSQIWVSQRPATVHRSVTSQADIVVSFRMHEERDVNYLRSVFGKERAEGLRHLPDYAVACYGDKRKAPLALLERLKAQKQAKEVVQPKKVV